MLEDLCVRHDDTILLCLQSGSCRSFDVAEDSACIEDRELDLERTRWAVTLHVGALLIEFTHHVIVMSSTLRREQQRRRVPSTNLAVTLSLVPSSTYLCKFCQPLRPVGKLLEAIQSLERR